MSPSASRWRAPVAAVVLAALAGCATPPPDPALQREAWLAHQAWLSTLSSWRTTGKVAVDVPQDSWSANLRWRQREAGFRIWLGGPFGQGAVDIEGDDSAVVLRTADGRRVEAATPERLVAMELGVDVPISRLRWWILGRPAPSDPVAALELDADGRLGRLEQSGWQVTYGDYREAGAGWLPSRLELVRGDVRARLVLSTWRTGA